MKTYRLVHVSCIHSKSIFELFLAHWKIYIPYVPHLLRADEGGGDIFHQKMNMRHVKGLLYIVSNALSDTNNCRSFVRCSSKLLCISAYKHIFLCMVKRGELVTLLHICTILKCVMISALLLLLYYEVLLNVL